MRDWWSCAHFTLTHLYINATLVFQRAVRMKNTKVGKDDIESVIADIDFG